MEKANVHNGNMLLENMNEPGDDYSDEICAGG